MIQRHVQSKSIAPGNIPNYQVLYVIARSPLLQSEDVCSFILDSEFLETRSRLSSVRLEIQNFCNQTSKRLHELIRTSNSSSEKQFIVQLRRDIYNCRPLKQGVLSKVSDSEYGKLKQIIFNYQQLLAKIERLKILIGKFWDQNVLHILHQMSHLFSSHSLLLEGIKLANAELSSQINPNLFRGSTSKKSRHIQERLMSFILRAAYRTTPFATFAYTAPIKSGPYLELDSGQKMRVNASLDMRRIRQAWCELIEDDFFLQNLEITLNPLLINSKNHLVFTSVFRKGQTIFEKQVLMRETAEFLRIIGKNRMSVKEVVKRSCYDNISCIVLIKKYLKTGLFTVSNKKSSDVFKDLLARLKKEKSSIQARWVAFLGEYGEAKKEKNSSSFVYKDIASPTSTSVPTHLYKDAERSLKKWCNRTVDLSWVKVENSILRAYFNRAFSKNTNCIPLPDFFRSYLCNPPRREKSPIASDVFEKRKCLLDTVNMAFREKQGLFQDEDISFLPCSLQNTSFRSIAAQVLPTKKHEWVLPHGAYCYGFGRGCSRFLDLHPELHTKLRRNYQNVNSAIMAELRSPEFFNGNIYPAIFNHAIYLPDQLVFDQEDVIPIPWSDLMVSKVGEHFLRLTNQEGQTVVPIDLGFLDFRQRHPLYRLLNCFGPSERFSLQLPWGDPQGSGIEHRPRLIFEQSLIIARETWRIPLNALPSSNSKEKDWEFADRLLGWATHHNIPLEGFFRLFDPSHASFLRPVQKKNMLASTILHRQEKPQYFNLSNPFVVKRLRILMTQLQEEQIPIMLEMQELLPGPPICELLVYLENS